MSVANEQQPETFQQFSAQQLEIYASELQSHYREERRLRRELENRNRELEQRVKELLSLNKMFQEFLARHFDACGPGPSPQTTPNWIAPGTGEATGRSLGYPAEKD